MRLEHSYTRRWIEWTGELNSIDIVTGKAKYFQWTASNSIELSVCVCVCGANDMSIIRIIENSIKIGVQIWIMDLSMESHKQAGSSK